MKKQKIILMIVIFTNMILWANSVDIEIHFALNKRSEIRSIDPNIEKLYFAKPLYITDIKGLDKLTKLKTIIFHNTAFLTRTDFLSDCPWIEIIIFDGAPIQDCTFIKKLSKLKVLVASTCDIKTISVDLINNTQLEYLDFSYNSLKDYPKLSNIPKTLKYLNLIGNQIDKQIAEIYPENLLILMRYNSIKEDSSSQVSCAYPSVILPEKYIFEGVLY